MARTVRGAWRGWRDFLHITQNKLAQAVLRPNEESVEDAPFKHQCSRLGAAQRQEGGQQSIINSGVGGESTRSTVRAILQPEHGVVGMEGQGLRCPL